MKKRKEDGLGGGADRDRTCDLLIANETLYQLSYDPIQFTQSYLRRIQGGQKTRLYPGFVYR